MDKKWASIAEVSVMERSRILDANDILDALEEAEDSANRKAEAESRRNRQPF